jgi:hypothetical protein
MVDEGLNAWKDLRILKKFCNRPSNVNSRIRSVMKNIENGHSETKHGQLTMLGRRRGK